MQIIKQIVIREPIPKIFQDQLIKATKERAEKDSNFAACRWHEQLEMMYEELYGNISSALDESPIESWYIEL